MIVLPFVRQIQEYHNYSINGSYYLSNRFSVKNIDEKKMLDSYRKLLKENDLLRSGFMRTSDGIVVRKIFSEMDESFSPKKITVGSEQEVSNHLYSFLEGKRHEPLDKIPLCELLIYSYFTTSIVYIIVNHIICDRVSLEMFKYILIGKYKSIRFEQEIISFGKYSQSINDKLRNHHLKRYKQLQHLGSNKLFNNQISLDNQYNFLSDISNLNYKPNISRQRDARLYFSAFQIPKELLSTKINWKSVFVAALLLIAREVYDQDKMIGYMFRDNFNFSTKWKTGDLLAENFIGYSLKTTVKKTDLKEITSVLLKSYRKGIFNYKMYDLDINEITASKAPFFLNFTYSHEDFQYNEGVKLDVFYKEYIVRCDFEPNIIMHKNGMVILKWIFDNSVIPEKDVININNRFKSILANKILTTFQ